MFDWLGGFIVRRGWLVIAAWVLLAAALHRAAPRWQDVANDGDLAYLPAHYPSVEGERLLRRAFPKVRSKSAFAVIVERPDGPLTAADLVWSDALAERFGHADLPIENVWNRNTPIAGQKLFSGAGKNGQATVTLLNIKHEFMATANLALFHNVLDILDSARAAAPAGLNVGVTGSAAIGGDMLRSAAESIKNTELTTIALVVVILLVVYRAPLLVSIPLITIGAAFFVSTDLLALLAQLTRSGSVPWWHFKIFTTTKIFIVVILFGSGTDFCLFLISRYKEELERGLERRAAVAEAVGRVGEALVASAMTTICGLGMMFFAEFGKFRNSGPAIALCLAITLVAGLTLAPALLRAGGGAVFWPLATGSRAGERTQRGGQLSPSRANRFWEWISRAIVARPGLILLVSTALLTPWAYHGLSVPITYDFLNELALTSPSVTGTALARRHFPAGEMSPLTVLALRERAGFNKNQGERDIAALTRQLSRIEGVGSVSSATQPLGDGPHGAAARPEAVAALEQMVLKGRFLTQVPELAGDVARFDLVLEDEPFSPRAVESLERVDRYLASLSANPASSWHDTQFTFGGTTAGIRDLARVTRSDQWTIEKLVVLSVLAVLLVLLRRPLVCAYLILSVLFSYFVTIGATQLYFSWLYGETYDGLDWKVPIFLFVILIAVGEDYNIYLLTRVVEEQRRHGPIEGLRRAVARTGGIITSCGVIMAGTFISMTSGTLRAMLELGFALSLGMMLDTCIVRPVLVPAFLALLQARGSDWRATEASDPQSSLEGQPAGAVAGSIPTNPTRERG